MTEPKWWDFTASKEKGATREKVIEILEPISDRFCIGDEVGGTTGYKHLQGRVVFKVGKDEKTVFNLFPKEWGTHWSQTHVRDFEYCKKEGNFYCSWEGVISKYANIELRAWQSEALGRWEDTAGDRKIMIIYDPRGNHGKTVLAKYCVATHQATYCPPMQEAMDFMAFAMAKPDKAYIFDMPRTESVKQRKGMWSAIEQIKNGYLYDKRYQFRDMWIDPPRVLVFCNQLPNKNDLTWDRWELYTIRDFGDWADLAEMEWPKEEATE